jgi:hypothetical protein
LNYIPLIDPLVDSLAIAIIAASIYFISRQKVSQQPDVKHLLLVVYALFEGVMMLEILRNFITDNMFITVYAIGATSFILWIVALLTLAGCFVYIKPEGKTRRERLAKIFVNFPHGYILFAFLSFITYSDLLIVIFPNTFKIQELPNAFGVMAPLKTVVFSKSWIGNAVVVLIGFICYSTTLFVAAARKTSNEAARRALYVLPIAWVAIGLELIIFNGLLVQFGYDIIGFGYLIAATASAFAAYSLRDSTTVASIFSPIKSQIMPVSNKFSRRLGESSRRVVDTFLLEFDPSSSYEKIVEDFAIEQISNRTPVFLFSSKGDPVYKILSKMDGARFYIFSDVSYAKPTDQPFEVLVPTSDPGVLLETIQKTVLSSTEQSVAIVYDSVTNMIVAWGTEGCYRFLKSVRDILSQPTVSALFLMTEGAHDEKTTKIVKSLFSNQLYAEKGGLKVVKRVEELAPLP